MKKTVAIVLLILLLTVPLSACSDQGEATCGTPDIPNYPEVFTARLNSACTEDSVSVTVDEAYKASLGESVTLSMEGLADRALRHNDEIRVVVSSVETTSPLTVNAASVQFIQNEEWYIQPYVPEDFPDLESLSAQITTLEYDWYDLFPNDFYVAAIVDEIVYLENASTGAFACILVGIPSENFSLGDYVEIHSRRFYQHTCGDQNYYSVTPSDISSFRVLTEAERSEQYPVLDKPVIYLYPEEETVCSVRVDLDGTLLSTYPEHGDNGWQNFIARPDGTLVFDNGREYYCLFWEGTAPLEPDFSKGFCVKGEDTAVFLETVLSEIGLTAREANEFIIYWLPLLEGNKYNLIAFQSDAYTDVACLEIDPLPDSLLRVYMTARPLDAPVEIEPQEFDGFERNGFTVVEWGGSIVP